MLASLNHPNIAGIYGLEESGGATALVMELVEGEELSAILGTVGLAARCRRPGKGGVRAYSRLGLGYLRSRYVFSSRLTASWKPFGSTKQSGL